MNAKKYFIAAIPKTLRENKELKILIGKMKRTFESRDREVRWVPPDLWHVTITYLGALSEGEIKAVKEELLAMGPPQALVLRVRGVGAFPDAKEARVLWLGVENSQELRGLKNNVDERLARAQIKTSDERPFTPHVTLARLRNLQSVTDLMSLGGRKAFGEYPVKELILMESVLQGAMVKYNPVFVVG